MMNGNFGFYPTQHVNGFSPIWNSALSNGITGTWGYNPFATTNPYTGYTGNICDSIYSGIPQGLQTFNPFTAGINTASHFANYTNGYTPWQNTTPFIGNTIPTIGYTPSNFVNGYGAQAFPLATNTTAYGNGYGTTPSFSNTIPTWNNTVPTWNNTVPTWNNTVPTWNNSFQPWNSSVGVNCGQHVPFVNGTTPNYFNGFVPNTNFIPAYGSTPNYTSYLNSLAGTPVVNSFTPAIPFATANAFYPTFNTVPSVPFNYVNGTPFVVPTGYPVGHVSPINQTSGTTDVNGKIQTGTIGLARNAA